MTGRRRSETIPRHQNPMVPQPGAPEANTAGFTGAHGGMGALEKGTILEVDARRHSYRVAMSNGSTVSMGRLRTSPGDVGLLEARTPVLVIRALGVPYIWAILPLDVEHSDVGPSMTDIEGHGGGDPLLDRHLNASSRNPGDPVDMMPGDRSLWGPDGAHVDAMRGRVAQLFGGPMANVQVFGNGDRVNVTAGEMRISTWMGYSEYQNVDGKTSFVWRGGSDQLTQTGAGEERYTLFLDAGETGDGIKLEMKNREGQSLFRFHVDPTGRGEMFFARGVSQSHGNSSSAVQTTSHHGNAVHEVTGNHTHAVGGNHAQTTEGAWRVNSGSIAEIIAAGALNLMATDDASVQTAGQMLLAASDGMRLVGKGVLVEPLTDPFEVRTVIPNAIKLGTGATSHAVKYEELLPILQGIISSLNALRSAFASATFPVSLGVAGPNPTYTAYSAPVTFDLTAPRALVVQLR